MLSLASYNAKIKEEKKEKFLNDIEALFGEVCNAPLADMNLGLIFKGMLEILRSNNLAIEGHFATLLTNMMILESIGKELDPKINIVSKAASFLI
jgi:aarF domain-containing kinase